MPAVVAAEELQELLLAWEEDLTRREEVLAAREEKARISEKILTKVSADLDAERAKAEATRNEYLDKMEAHTACAKHSLGLDKMLGEKKVDRAAEAKRQAILVMDVSKVLMDLGMSPILGIPQDQRTAVDVLEVVDIILECLREVYASDHDTWD
jgi:hypothetical protein